jgi:metal-sulfur cluster biosynthetic enzyme
MTDAKASEDLEKSCYEALGTVVDPELGVDVVSLGLVYHLVLEDGLAIVEMTMTSPGCPVADQLLFQAQNELLKVPGVERAKVNLVWSPPWTPEMMSLEAKMMLGFA